MKDQLTPTERKVGSSLGRLAYFSLLSAHVLLMTIPGSLFYAQSVQAQDQNWITFTNALGGGNPTTVNALAVAGTNIYVGGDFISAGGIVANRIAKWNGVGWSALGNGSSNGFNLPVLTLAANGSGEVYAGGSFSQAGGINASRLAKWDGTHWSPLGLGLTSDGSINAIAVAPNGDVYAGGFFSSIGNVSANNIARWDGTNWFDVAGGLTRGQFSAVVKALVFVSGSLYVGGSFDTAGSTHAVGFAKWDGSSWSSVGGGISSTQFNPVVEALAFDGSNWYVGGVFTQAGNINANRIARWDGQNWFAMGTGTDSDVRAIFVFGSEVFIGGNFTSVDGQHLPGLARWLGNRWWPVGNGIGGGQPFVNQFATDLSGLFVGGTFSQAGGKPSTGFARWKLAGDVPVVQITSPTNGALFTTDDTIALAADAASPNGSIQNVEFFSDGLSLGVATVSPYTVSWSNPMAGSHVLSAVATDQTSATQSSVGITVTIYRAPFITQQPQTQSTTNGGTVNLTAAAIGAGPLSFQWLKDTMPIPGATTTTLTLTNLHLSESALYAMQVSNAWGSVTSAPAAVSVLQPVGSLWVRQAGLQVRTSPAIGPGGVVYLGTDNNNLFAFGANGAFLWRYQTGDYVQSSPAVGADGTIYFGSIDHKIYGLTPNGTALGSFLTGSAVTAAPAIGTNGTIYIGSWDTNFYAINTNGSTQWVFPTLASITSAAAIGSDGTVYIPSGDSNLYAVSIAGTNTWSFDTGGALYNSPVIDVDGTIYIASDHKLYALHPDGTEKWEFTGAGPFYSSPVIGADGTLYIGNDGVFDPSKGTLRGRLYAITPGGAQKWEFITGTDCRLSVCFRYDLCSGAGRQAVLRQRSHAQQ